jgi:type VI secretion system secreted protein Hcp
MRVWGRDRKGAGALAVTRLVSIVRCGPARGVLSVSGEEFMPIYMHIDGIKGSVTEEAHKQWIDCGSLQFGVGRAISTRIGSGHNREASAPTISEITITKQQDESSIELFGLALGSKEGKTVKIDFVTTGESKNVYLQLELTNTLISGFSISSGGDRPTESLSLNFTKIQEKWTPFTDQNKAGTPVVKSYDLAQAKLS